MMNSIGLWEYLENLLPPDWIVRDQEDYGLNRHRCSEVDDEILMALRRLLRGSGEH